MGSSKISSRKVSPFAILYSFFTNNEIVETLYKIKQYIQHTIKIIVIIEIMNLSSEIVFVFLKELEGQ
jgi:hypothetical protein